MQFKFEAIGTHWTLDIEDELSADASNILSKKIHNRIEEFDLAYSRFRKDSLVSLMAQERGVYQLPSDAQPLFDLYKKLYDLTSGKFTPLIGSTLEQAGYDSEYSLEPKELVQPLAWDEALVLDFPNIEIMHPVLLDLGAAGKGYLVDIVADLLESSGVKTFSVDAGGDIVHHTERSEPLSIGLENPFDVTQAIGVAKILNQSLCCSAGNRRKWEGYHHIINPETLTSPESIAAIWVLAENGLTADGLATALFFSEPEVFQSDFSFEYLILYTDSSIKRSNGFPAELFYK